MGGTAGQELLIRIVRPAGIVDPHHERLRVIQRCNERREFVVDEEEDWPTIPRSIEWKHGICAALGWPHNGQADIAAAWQRIRCRVRDWTDLEPEASGGRWEFAHPELGVYGQPLETADAG